MNLKRITIAVAIELLPALETSLRSCGAPRVTVKRVRICGRHPCYFRRDPEGPN